MTLEASSRAPLPYFIDPEDPRAPPTHVWNAMTAEQRARVADELPSELELDFLPPPEGDSHTRPKNAAQDALGRHFRYTGRRVYVSGELPIYYPNERVFAADVIAVLDVEPHARDSWLVDLEGKGIDFALEIHVRGDRRKDMKRNVERYARLGIPEYFVYEPLRGVIHGFRLVSPDARIYERIPAHRARLESRVLGMELTISASKLRFLIGGAPLPDAEEVIEQLGAVLDMVLAHKESADRHTADLEQELAEVQAKLAEAQAEIERLKRGT